MIESQIMPGQSRPADLCMCIFNLHEVGMEREGIGGGDGKKGQMKEPK